jgi:heat shock protein HslJ
MTRIFLLALLFLSACGKDEGISGYTDTNAVWGLVQMNGREVPVGITLAFPSRGKLTGRAPCNSYSGAQKAPLPWFEAASVVSTKRACPQMSLETEYFTTLNAMQFSEATGDTLVLNADSGLTLMFKKL